MRTLTIVLELYEHESSVYIALLPHCQSYSLYSYLLTLLLTFSLYYRWCNPHDRVFGGHHV